MPYNVLTCSGWESATAGWFASSDCLKARIEVIAMFFLVAIVNKWVFPFIGVPFNMFFGWIGMIAGWFITITIFGAPKVAFVIGMAGALAGGIFGGMSFGGTSE